MSDVGDASVTSDQDQVNDQFNDEDAGGLFGSGSEDEQSGYEALLHYKESKLILLILVPIVSATNVAN